MTRKPTDASNIFSANVAPPSTLLAVARSAFGVSSTTPLVAAQAGLRFDLETDPVLGSRLPRPPGTKQHKPVTSSSRLAVSTQVTAELYSGSPAPVPANWPALQGATDFTRRLPGGQQPLHARGNILPGQDASGAGSKPVSGLPAKVTPGAFQAGAQTIPRRPWAETVVPKLLSKFSANRDNLASHEGWSVPSLAQSLSDKLALGGLIRGSSRAPLPEFGDTSTRPLIPLPPVIVQSTRSASKPASGLQDRITRKDVEPIAYRGALPWSVFVPSFPQSPAGDLFRRLQAAKVTSPGVLLARVTVEPNHYLEFRLLPAATTTEPLPQTAGVSIVEVGENGNVPVDRTDWESQGAHELYRSLCVQFGCPFDDASYAKIVDAVADFLPPQPLERDTRNIGVGPDKPKPKGLGGLLGGFGADVVGAINSAISSEAETLGAWALSGRVATPILQVPVDPTQTVAEGLNFLSIGQRCKSFAQGGSWEAWSDLFCSVDNNVDADSVRSTKDRSFAVSDVHHSMYYQAAGMAYPRGFGADFLVEFYDRHLEQWTGGYAITLSAGQWVIYTMQGEITFRSSIRGRLGMGVHFVEKSRRAPTYLTPLELMQKWDWAFGSDIQGLTHDEENWYFSRTEYGAGGANFGQLGTRARDELAKRPRAEPPGLLVFPHFGALTYANGHLFVATDEGAGTKTAQVAVYDTNLELIGTQELGPGPCGWIAFNPRDGHFYAPDGHRSGWLVRYEIGVEGDDIEVRRLGSIFLAPGVDNVQGGAFSERGVLWLFGTVKNLPLHIYAVDVQNGRVYPRGLVEVKKNRNPDEWEAEGIAVWDLTTAESAEWDGHIHLQVLRNRNPLLYNDEVFYMHLRANRPEAL